MWIAVRCLGHVEIVEGGRIASGQPFRHVDPLRRCGVGQGELAGDVADGVDAGDSGGEIVVDGNEAVLGGDADGLQPQAFHVALNADGHQDATAGHVHLAGTGFHPQDGGVAVPFKGEGPGARHYIDALSPQGPLQQLAYLRVLVGQQLGHHLNDGHVDAVGVVDRCELDAYGASAEHHGIGGQVSLLQGLAAGDDHLLVDGQNGEGPGPGARGDDDVFGGYHSIVGGDVECCGRR